MGLDGSARRPPASRAPRRRCFPTAGPTRPPPVNSAAVTDRGTNLPGTRRHQRPAGQRRGRAAGRPYHRGRRLSLSAATGGWPWERWSPPGLWQRRPRGASCTRQWWAGRPPPAGRGRGVGGAVLCHLGAHPLGAACAKGVVSRGRVRSCDLPHVPSWRGQGWRGMGEYWPSTIGWGHRRWPAGAPRLPSVVPQAIACEGKRDAIPVDGLSCAPGIDRGRPRPTSGAWPLAPGRKAAGWHRRQQWRCRWWSPTAAAGRRARRLVAR